MTAPVSSQRKKIHPHKFTLWVAIASIIMMFAGLTSAYLVKGSLPGWAAIEVPKIFYYSTAILLLSSITLQLGLKQFKERQRQRYRQLMGITLILGAVFLIMQVMGFQQLYQAGIKMEGSGAGQFLYIIFGLHGLHVAGGVIALLVMFLQTFSSRFRSYNPVPLEVMSTYWHFVDVLWIYLFVFFLMKL